jgi:uncharacterized protein (DUF924 family)
MGAMVSPPTQIGGTGRTPKGDIVEPREILDFWLRDVGPERWYAADPAIDAEIARRFEGAVAEARKGAYEKWILHADSALALIVLLDQFPRNLWRGRPEAFQSDIQAVALAKRAIHLGHDRRTPEPERQFFYLPLMHAESLMDQDRCVRLVLTRMPETGADNLRHAVAHRDLIRRFGRFPYRNAALGRTCTEAEAAWLEAGGYAA